MPANSNTVSGAFAAPLRSMTGFGTARVVLPIGEALVEVKSVNGKNLDARFSLPQECFALEMELRRLLKERLGRGTVHLRLTIQNGGSAAGSASPERLAGRVAELRELAGRLGLGQEGNLDTLIRLCKLEAESGVSDLEEYQEQILQGTAAALDDLVAAREREGEVLRQDLLERLGRLAELRERIVKLAPAVVEDFNRRLTARLEELSRTAGVPFDPVRILTEVGVFSERADIAEELTRLASHFALYETALREGGVAGRRLDFVNQEIFREITTLGNKAMSAEISPLVVKMKEELEKMREQAQNIE